MYRSAPELLAAKSPTVYRVIRDWDQNKLDRAYAVGGMMRGVDGRIVRNTVENWQRRTDMERRFGIN